MARVTIGLAVRNGAGSIRTAIEGILAQTHRDIFLHISDNASEDGTGDICRDYAARDPRIRYTRHERNVGPYNNFRHVLFAAETPFFMWASHDDWHEPDFIAENIANLQAHPQAILSVSRIEFFFRGGGTYLARGTAPLTGTVLQNLREYLWDPSDSSRLHGLWRTEPLRKSFPAVSSCYFMDHLICGLSLLHGHHLEVPRVLFHREAPAEEKYYPQMNRDEPTRFTRLFPCYRFSKYLMQGLPARYRPFVLPALVKINFYNHVYYVSHRSKFWKSFWSIARGMYRFARGQGTRTESAS